MKKTFIVLTLVALTAFSCKNDNSVNPQPLGKATVSGTVFADFDKTNDTDGTTWEAVANKKVIVSIEDYNDNVRYTETTTDADGKYAFEVEVGNQNLYVRVELADFRADVKYSSDKTKSEIFYGDHFYSSVTIEKGGEYIRDLYYGDND
jgi:hypothetical protein